MGKRHKTGGGAASGSRPGSERTERVGRGRHRDPKGRALSWFRANRSDLRFLLIFGLCLVSYYLLTLTPPIKRGFFPAYLALNARVSAGILHAFGEDVRVEGQSMISAKGPAIEIERGCDAIEPSALLASAVMASPVPFVSRLLAVGAGTALLMLLNLVRIISLYLFQVHYPAAFETMHLDVWQALFIILAIVLWGMWASRAVRRKAVVSNAPA